MKTVIAKKKLRINDKEYLKGAEITVEDPRADRLVKIGYATYKNPDDAPKPAADTPVEAAAPTPDPAPDAMPAADTPVEDPEEKKFGRRR